MDTLPILSKETLEKLQAGALRTGQSVDEYVQWLLEKDNTISNSEFGNQSDQTTREEKAERFRAAVIKNEARSNELGLDQQQLLDENEQGRPEFVRSRYNPDIFDDATGNG